jgi:hypothetical protein
VPTHSQKSPFWLISVDIWRTVHLGAHKHGAHWREVFWSGAAMKPGVERILLALFVLSKIVWACWLGIGVYAHVIWIKAKQSEQAADIVRYEARFNRLRMPLVVLWATWIFVWLLLITILMKAFD